MIVRALTLLLLLWPGVAAAHKPSDSYLTINGEEGALTVQWDIALRDLDHALGLDLDDDGAITWGELRSRHDLVAAYALARLAIGADGRLCETGPPVHQVDEHSDGVYAVMTFALRCAAPPTRLSVRYDLFFDLDPQHRGLLSVASGGGSTAAVIGPDNRAVTIELGQFEPGNARQFFVDGIWHLLGGADHLLFLLVLLLPAIFGQSDPPPSGSYWVTFVRTAKILSAFTVGHACTLSAAVLGYLALPMKPVEIAIALSIGITAIDNLWPVLGRRRWPVAGIFGLIHGFGYANVLAPLGLPPQALAVTLLAFNLGLEAAQILVAALLIPIGQLLPHRRAALVALQHGGSVLALGIAGAWVGDRSFNLQIMPF